jgi:hypothetical protein
MCLPLPQAEEVKGKEVVSVGDAEKPELGATEAEQLVAVP